MAGNLQIPRRATEIDTEHGVMTDGTILEVIMYRHIPQGRAVAIAQGREEPAFYFVSAQRDPKTITGGNIRTGTIIARHTFQVTGKNATERAAKDMADTRKTLLATRTDVGDRTVLAVAVEELAAREEFTS